MLGDRIKALRIEKNITQQQLADLLAVGKSTIGMWETNKREPDLETIRRIAEILDTPMTFLLNDIVRIGREYCADTDIEHCCPICGYNYIHLVDSLPIDFHESPKSSGYALKFQCEAEHIFYIVIEDYKGNNYMTYTDEHFRPIKPVLQPVQSFFETKFDSLDKYGRKAVRDLLDTEYERCVRHARADRSSIRIKLHQNKASAGFGYDLSDKDEWKEIEVVETGKTTSADFAVEVEGDSMLPDFHDGDIVLIKFDPDVPVGEVGLFVHDGKGYIKERGKKKLISRNPDYPDIEGKSRCIGLVIGIAETV